MEKEVKELERIEKVLKEGLQAVNYNLTDIAKSLRKLAEKEEKEEQKAESWIPAIGPKGRTPGPEYDVVLVKIQTLGRDLKVVMGPVLNNPCIAKYSERFGKWSLCVGDGVYEDFETEEFSFRVVQWKPIPGDRLSELKDKDGKVIDVWHEYE